STSRISRRTRTEANGNEVEPPTKPPIEKTVDLRRNHAAINRGTELSRLSRVAARFVYADRPRPGRTTLATWDRGDTLQRWPEMAVGRPLRTSPPRVPPARGATTSDASDVATPGDPVDLADRRLAP